MLLVGMRPCFERCCAVLCCWVVAEAMRWVATLSILVNDVESGTI